MASKENVIQGPGVIKWGDTPTDFGYTSGGVFIDQDEERLVIKSDQDGIIKNELIDRTVKVKTNLLEATLEVMRVALNLPAGNLTTGAGTKTLLIDNAEDTPFKITIIGLNENGLARTFTIWQVRSIVSGQKYNMEGEKETLIPVEFEALWDEANSGYYEIVDTTA